jgi:septal ring factor EnvC (AmiA/AmiB activator)
MGTSDKELLLMILKPLLDVRHRVAEHLDNLESIKSNVTAFLKYMKENKDSLSNSMGYNIYKDTMEELESYLDELSHSMDKLRSMDKLISEHQERVLALDVRRINDSRLLSELGRRSPK